MAAVAMHFNLITIHCFGCHWFGDILADKAVVSPFYLVINHTHHRGMNEGIVYNIWHEWAFKMEALTLIQYVFELHNEYS